MMRAAAMGYFHQGASSMYLFNYEHRFRGLDEPYTPEEVQTLKEIGDPKVIATRNKRYVVTVDQHPYYTGAEESDQWQLPAVLRRVGDKRRFTCCVGDDLASAKREGLLKAVRLRLTLGSYRAPGDAVRVRLNGKRIERDDSVWRPQALMYSDIPVEQGTNVLTVSLAERRKSAQSPLRIDGIEILVNYGNGP